MALPDWCYKKDREKINYVKSVIKMALKEVWKALTAREISHISDLLANIRKLVDKMQLYMLDFYMFINIWTTKVFIESDGGFF
jgi:wobble nucleotide-excising tRNase